MCDVAGIASGPEKGRAPNVCRRFRADWKDSKTTASTLLTVKEKEEEKERKEEKRRRHVFVILQLKRKEKGKKKKGTKGGTKHVLCGLRLKLLNAAYYFFLSFLCHYFQIKF